MILCNDDKVSIAGKSEDLLNELVCINRSLKRNLDKAGEDGSFLILQACIWARLEEEENDSFEHSDA